MNTHNAAPVLLALTLALVAVVPASAESAAGDEERRSPRETYIDAHTSKYLTAATEAYQAERLDEARALLGKLKPSRLSPYERSRVEQLLAAIAQVEQDYIEARGHLEAAVDSGGMARKEAADALFQVAQFAVAEEDWNGAVTALGQWFAMVERPDAEAWYLLGVAHYQLEDFEAALTPARRAIEASEGEPRENHLQLLLALHVRREEFESAVPILQRLVSMFPDKKLYWTQLSSVHAALSEYEEAARALRLAYDAGLLTDEGEIRRLAELLYHVGIPRRAAEILAHEIDENGRFAGDARVHELLGNCWIASREYSKAVPALARAAELSDNGNLYVRLAQVHVQDENWQAAAEALQSGLGKGEISNPAAAQLLLGIALYNQKQPDKARPWFEMARTDSNYRPQAEGWLRQLETSGASHSS